MLSASVFVKIVAVLAVAVFATGACGLFAADGTALAAMRDAPAASMPCFFTIF